MTMRLACVFLLGALAACPSGRSGGQLGKERSDCKPDKTCDPGLLCLSNLCVKPPPADCAELAETLASMELGNYAEPEERAPVVSKFKARCETVYVTKEQGQCIDKTRDKWSAEQCAPGLFPELGAAGASGDCNLIAEKLQAMLERQQANYGNNDYMAKVRGAMVRSYRASCSEDRWPSALTKCILAADMTQNAGSVPPGCNEQMSPELQQKLQERLQKAMQEAQR